MIACVVAVSRRANDTVAAHGARRCRPARLRPFRTRARPSSGRSRVPYRAYDPIAPVPSSVRVLSLEHLTQGASFVVVAVPVPRMRQALIDLRRDSPLVSPRAPGTATAAWTASRPATARIRREIRPAQFHRERLHAIDLRWRSIARQGDQSAPLFGSGIAIPFGGRFYGFRPLFT